MPVITRPDGDQIRFFSSKTGESVLDNYLEGAEIGGRSLAALLGDVFDSGTGKIKSSLISFRVNTATREFESRSGDYGLSTDGWLGTGAYFSRYRGEYTSGTRYLPSDFVRISGLIYLVVTDHTSGPSPTMANFVDIVNSPTLSALGSATGAAADQLPFFTSPTVAAFTTLSSFGRSLIDDVNAATARATLGLSAAATMSLSAVPALTMAGDLSLQADPMLALQAATKQYVDAEAGKRQANLGFTPVNRAGDSLTGFLLLHANPTSSLHAAPKQYVDSAVSAAAAGNGDKWYAGWVTNPGVDANTLAGSRSGFTYANNAPSSGPIAHFEAGGYGLQINAGYGGSTNLDWRTRNGDAGSWNPWRAIYHTGNFNPANYAALSGADFSSLKVGGSSVWTSGNLNPANYLPLTGGTLTSWLAVGGSVAASGVGGFLSSTYSTNARNPIWRFGNADGFGLSYFQGTAGIGGDTIGLHFGTSTAAGSQFQFNQGGSFNASGAITQAGQQVYHAGNFNPASYAPLAGGTLTGTIYTSGVVASGGQTTGIANGSGSLGGVELKSSGSGAAFMAFHRPGIYAAYFGLDTNNQFSVGGWSAGAVSNVLLHAGNYTSYSPALIGTGASGTWGISITGAAAATAMSFGRTDVAAYPVTWGVEGATSQLYSCAAVRIQSSTGTLSATTFSGSGSGLSGTASSLTAGAVPWPGVTGKSLRSTWADTGEIARVVGELAWKNYNNNHTIFDASNGTSPSGSAVNNTNAGVAWAATYPTLMGWNGTSTYGVRVDSARVADNATTAGGLAIATGVNSTANQIVRTDSQGYVYTGWINTVSGDAGAGAITRVYASTDSFLRYYTLANFTEQVRTSASGSWAINVTGSAGKASTLAQGGGAGVAMTFNWSGQSGTPTWVWGGSDGINHYVYNPANFSVNYATSAGTAGSASRARGLNRSDSGEDSYNVQSWWDGVYWELKGYANTTFHAGVKVAYAASAGAVTYSAVSGKPVTTVTASAAVPTGGSVGDIVFQY